MVVVSSSICFTRALSSKIPHGTWQCAFATEGKSSAPAADKPADAPANLKNWEACHREGAHGLDNRRHGLDVIILAWEHDRFAGGSGGAGA
jgi:hypothetical protein